MYDLDMTLLYVFVYELLKLSVYYYILIINQKLLNHSKQL